MRTLAAMGLALPLLVHVLPARALTVAECEAWMVQLGGETAGLPLPRAERDSLLRQLDEATRKDRERKPRESLESVTTFQERAAALARDGKVSRTEGERLKNLSEAVRRCLDSVGGGNQP
jgi:hypothetical protein